MRTRRPGQVPERLGARQFDCDGEQKHDQRARAGREPAPSEADALRPAVDAHEPTSLAEHHVDAASTAPANSSAPRGTPLPDGGRPFGGAVDVPSKNSQRPSGEPRWRGHAPSGVDPCEGMRRGAQPGDASASPASPRWRVLGSPSRATVFQDEQPFVLEPHSWRVVELRCVLSGELAGIAFRCSGSVQVGTLATGYLLFRLGWAPGSSTPAPLRELDGLPLPSVRVTRGEPLRVELHNPTRKARKVRLVVFWRGEGS